MNRNRTRRSRLAVAAVTVPLALGVVACGDDSDSDDGAVSTTTPTAPETTTTTAPAAEAPAESAPATPVADGDLLTAAATGLATVDGGTVFAVDRNDTGGWEVSVVNADGTEYDVRVAADGTTVEGPPVEDTDDDTRDRDERVRLLDVALDYAAAIDAAAGGTPTDVELDEENGAATWEIAFAGQTVTVDANTGDVLGTETDD